MSKEDDLFIDELSNTKAVKEMARVFKVNLKREDAAQLIAAYLFFSAKGRSKEAFNYFLIDRFTNLMKAGFKGFIDLLPELITDPHFFKMMLSLFGKRFSLKKLFK